MIKTRKESNKVLYAKDSLITVAQRDIKYEQEQEVQRLLL